MLIAASAPAAAQLGGSVTLSSEARLRGRPISDHRPVARLELDHDSASGFYVGGSAAIVVTRDEGIRPFAYTQYAGFTHRVAGSTAIDAGLVHNGYSEYSGVAGGGSYTEAYVGLVGPQLSARLYLSPGYFRKDEPTLYMEVDGHVDIGRNGLLFAHVGRLTYLRDHPGRARAASTDWRIGLRRRLGTVDLEAAWTGYAHDEGYYGARIRTGSTMLVALAFGF